jgi:hypothetical protein
MAPARSWLWIFDFLLGKCLNYVHHANPEINSLLYSPVKGVECQNTDFRVESTVSSCLKEEGCQLCNMWAEDWHFLHGVSQVSPCQQKMERIRTRMRRVSNTSNN